MIASIFNAGKEDLEAVQGYKMLGWITVQHDYYTNNNHVVFENFWDYILSINAYFNSMHEVEEHSHGGRCGSGLLQTLPRCHCLDLHSF